MRMTPDQIIEEASHWPNAQVAELVDRLMHTLDAVTDSEIAAAWKTETRRRLAEQEDGRVQAIPGDAVSRRIRQIVGRWNRMLSIPKRPVFRLGNLPKEAQRVCMRVAGGKEDGGNEDFAGQSSANFLSSAA